MSSPEPDGASFPPALRERAERSRASRRTVLRGLALALVPALLTLAGCGKKSPPSPPRDEPNTFPRTYPRE